MTRKNYVEFNNENEYNFIMPKNERLSNEATTVQRRNSMQQSEAKRLRLSKVDSDLQSTFNERVRISLYILFYFVI